MRDRVNSDSRIQMSKIKPFLASKLCQEYGKQAASLLSSSNFLGAKSYKIPAKTQSFTNNKTRKDASSLIKKQSQRTSNLLKIPKKDI